MKRLPIVLCALFVLAACSALDPGPPLAQLALNPALPGAGPGPRLQAQLGVALVETHTALNTARIVAINSRHIQYLPDVQWASPAPRIMQLLLIRALGNTRRFAGIGGETNISFSDYQVFSFLDSMAVITDRGQGMPEPPYVQISLGMQTVARNGRVVDYTEVRAASAAMSMRIADLQDAFEDALGSLLKEATDWVLKTVEKAEAAKQAADGFKRTG